MAIKSSGSLSFSEIESEFGSNNSRSLGDYRISQSVGSLSGLALDSDNNFNPLIPKSGQIKFSDFYGTRLNVVVDFHSGGQESRQNAKTRYNNNNVTVIGGFRGKKQAGSKILVHVNKTIGSEKGNQNKVALRTGTWNSDVVLTVDVGSSGTLFGAGGNGGKGSDSWSDAGSSNAGSGGDGTSALGIEHEETLVRIQGGGSIRCGYGGGGGGSGARQKDSGADRSACGGGGGGGAGLPAGDAGEAGLRQSGGADEVASGSDGGNATTFENGEGGGGGNNDDEAFGGSGGRGGDESESAKDGGGGSPSDGSASGSAGADGGAIRAATGSISFEIINSSGVIGSTSGTGVE